MNSFYIFFVKFVTQILIISNIALETFTFSDLTNQKKVARWGFHHWLSTPCVTLGNHILVFSGNLLWTNKKSLLIYSNISYLESRTESVNKININISRLPLQTIPVFKQRHYSKSNTCIKHQRIDYDRMNLVVTKSNIFIMSSDTNS